MSMGLISEALQHLDLHWGPEAALLLFTSFLLGLLVWIFRSNAAAFYATIARHPLDDEG
jgi:cbb3-type cytochrome oxidase subunit 3